MDLCRLEFTDAVHRQGGFVRNYPAPLGPQDPTGEVVMGVGDPLREPEKPTVDAEPVASVDVMRLGLVGVSGVLH